jgi:hypothetical protein
MWGIKVVQSTVLNEAEGSSRRAVNAVTTDAIRAKKYSNTISGVVNVSKPGILTTKGHIFSLNSGSTSQIPLMIVIARGTATIATHETLQRTSSMYDGNSEFHAMK